MKLVLLGTNVLVPSEKGGQTACYMLPEQGIVLDAGTGLYRLAQHLRTSSLDIYLTHAHGDHTLGLFYLRHAVLRNLQLRSELQITDETFATAWQSATEFMSRVRIHAAPETLRALHTDPVYRDLIGKWNWQLLELDSETKLADAGTLTHFPLEHTVPCYGFRLNWPGHSLAYVTDTIAKPDAAYVDHIEGVNLLLHERTMPDTLANTACMYGHSHTMAVAQVAAAARVGRVVLIHDHKMFGSELEKARAIFPKTDVGLDGMEIEF